MRKRDFYTFGALAIVLVMLSVIYRNDLETLKRVFLLVFGTLLGVLVLLYLLRQYRNPQHEFRKDERHTKSSTSSAEAGVLGVSALKVRLRALLKEDPDIFERHRTWILIAGETGSGKSDAIENGGILTAKQLELSRSRTSSTPDYDFCLTEQGVIMDISGRIVVSPIENAEASESAWRFLLEGVLRKYRPQRPVNGLVIVLSVERLLSGDLTATKAHATQIANRMAFMCRALGKAKLPTFILITMADRLEGFRDYVRTIRVDDKIGCSEQIVGWSNPDKVDEPRRMDSVMVNEIFEGIGRDFRRSIIHNFYQAPTSEARDRLVSLPKQIANLAERVKIYTEQLFPNTTDNSKADLPALHLRGIYFTSTRELNGAIDSVLPTEYSNKPKLPKNSHLSDSRSLPKPLFLKMLWRDKIHAEAGLVTFDGNWTRIAVSGSRILAILAIVSAVILACVMWSSSDALHEDIGRHREMWLALDGDYRAWKANQEAIGDWMPLLTRPSDKMHFSIVKGLKWNPQTSSILLANKQAPSVISLMGYLWTLQNSNVEPRWVFALRNATSDFEGSQRIAIEHFYSSSIIMPLVSAARMRLQEVADKRQWTDVHENAMVTLTKLEVWNEKEPPPDLSSLFAVALWDGSTQTGLSAEKLHMLALVWGDLYCSNSEPDKAIFPLPLGLRESAQPPVREQVLAHALEFLIAEERYGRQVDGLLALDALRDGLNEVGEQTIAALENQEQLCSDIESINIDKTMEVHRRKVFDTHASFDKWLNEVSVGPPLSSEKEYGQFIASLEQHFMAISLAQGDAVNQQVQLREALRVINRRIDDAAATMANLTMKFKGLSNQDEDSSLVESALEIEHHRDAVVDHFRTQIPAYLSLEKSAGNQLHLEMWCRLQEEANQLEGLIDFEVCKHLADSIGRLVADAKMPQSVHAMREKSRILDQNLKEYSTVIPRVENDTRWVNEVLTNLRSNLVFDAKWHAGNCEPMLKANVELAGQLSRRIPNAEGDWSPQEVWIQKAYLTRLNTQVVAHSLPPLLDLAKDINKAVIVEAESKQLKKKIFPPALPFTIPVEPLDFRMDADAVKLVLTPVRADLKQIRALASQNVLFQAKEFMAICTDIDERVDSFLLKNENDIEANLRVWSTISSESVKTWLEFQSALSNEELQGNIYQKYSEMILGVMDYLELRDSTGRRTGLSLLLEMTKDDRLDVRREIGTVSRRMVELGDDPDAAIKAVRMSGSESDASSIFLLPVGDRSLFSSYWGQVFALGMALLADRNEAEIVELLSALEKYERVPISYVVKDVELTPQALDDALLIIGKLQELRGEDASSSSLATTPTLNIAMRRVFSPSLTLDQQDAYRRWLGISKLIGHLRNNTCHVEFDPDATYAESVFLGEPLGQGKTVQTDGKVLDIVDMRSATSLADLQMPGGEALWSFWPSPMTKDSPLLEIVLPQQWSAARMKLGAANGSFRLRQGGRVANMSVTVSEKPDDGGWYRSSIQIRAGVPLGEAIPPKKMTKEELELLRILYECGKKPLELQIRFRFEKSIDLQEFE